MRKTGEHFCADALVSSGRRIPERIVVLLGIALMLWVSVIILIYSDHQTSFGEPQESSRAAK